MNDKLSVPTELVLCGVELSFEEVLSLREGGSFSIKRPGKLQGTIKIDGSPWALVDLDIQPETLNVSVVGLTALPEERNEERKLFPISFDLISSR